MNFENLGDWCKWLEKNFSPEVMIPTLPVIIRLDGVNFRLYTKGLQKPFDKGLTNLMIDTAKFLIKETGAIISYIQSDEITLILYSDDRHSKIYHDGKKQKILSKLTAKCVMYFNTNRPMYLPEHDKVANFDARIYQTPTLQDAVAQLLWRENDATKNSISMLVQSMFSHDELNGVNGNQKQEKMISEKGVDWNDLDARFKRGTYVQKIKTSSPFSAEELSALPKKHNAHKNPDLVIERNVIKEVEMPPFNDIKNAVDVIFFGHPVKLEVDPTIKTMEAWDKAMVDFEKFVNPMDEVDEGIYLHIAEWCTPTFQNDVFMQSGEMTIRKDEIEYYDTFYTSQGRYFYLGVLPKFE